MKMKLAQALILRADQQRRIEQVKARLLRNAKVQEGDRPAGDPNVLINELSQLTRELELIVQRINTNEFADGQSPRMGRSRML